MAIRPDEDAPSGSTDTNGATASRRTSDLDLTKANTGPVWRQYLRAMGPGLVTGASDDDPSGIATYSQAGAKYGLSLLWAALLTLPLMAAVQEICDRTALATGTGLGELAVKRFGRAGRAVLGVLLIALVVANALNIAADLVAIGSGMQLLHAGPVWLWALLAGGLITALLVLGSFARIALIFKVLCAGAGSVGLAGLLGKQWGFSRSVRKAPVFYSLVALGTLGGTALSLVHVNPIKTPVVIDASAGVELAADTIRGRALRKLLPIDAVPWTPEVFYIECGAVLRRWDLNGILTPPQIASAIDELMP